jgi:hypothetical protein
MGVSPILLLSLGKPRFPSDSSTVSQIMPPNPANPLQKFFTDLPPKESDLVILCLDLQLTMSKSRSDEEKQDLLEARILKLGD